MISIGKPILSIIKRYDNKLYFKWNNEKSYFELWRKMIHGDRLITPIVSSIYTLDSKDFYYTHVDFRLLNWLIGADSTRSSKNWMWSCRKKYDEKIRSKNRKHLNEYKNIAKDTYNVACLDLLHASAENCSNDNFLRPDIKGGRRRTFLRSKENAKKYFGENK